MVIIFTVSPCHALFRMYQVTEKECVAAPTGNLNAVDTLQPSVQPLRHWTRLPLVIRVAYSRKDNIREEKAYIAVENKNNAYIVCVAYLTGCSDYLRM